MDNEQISMEDFLSAFNAKQDTEEGTNTEGEENTEGTEGTETGTENNTEGEGAEDTGNGEENKGDAQKDPAESGVSKQAAAFAQMRVENKQLNDMLKGVADVLGVKDISDKDTFLGSLKGVITEAQAKKQGVPPEILSKLQKLEERDQEFTASQLKQAAYLGFQKVKDSFNLTDEQLSDFAGELNVAGLNPFVDSIDIVAEYKLRNYDKLLEAAVQKGIQQEAERAAKASQQSSTPNNKNGKGETDNGKVTTQKDLEAWFNQQSK